MCFYLKKCSDKITIIKGPVSILISVRGPAKEKFGKHWCLRRLPPVSSGLVFVKTKQIAELRVDEIRLSPNDERICTLGKYTRRCLPNSGGYLTSNGDFTRGQEQTKFLPDIQNKYLPFFMIFIPPLHPKTILLFVYKNFEIKRFYIFDNSIRVVFRLQIIIHVTHKYIDANDGTSIVTHSMESK